MCAHLLCRYRVDKYYRISTYHGYDVRDTPTAVPAKPNICNSTCKGSDLAGNRRLDSTRPHVPVIFWRERIIWRESASVENAC